ncbi:hypothetical protein BDN71DRAFT_1430371 [Pleurotus eryngii]|uniref:Uncharacterized protein n=1 Tax=Pleurotus eryngii TaxID=5323 RepID=A0A9P6D9D9_PLEER|nr:hypothetical protein BDN71DRAFT_1430371 [Pleurotus eryngii]
MWSLAFRAVDTSMRRREAFDAIWHPRVRVIRMTSTPSSSGAAAVSILHNCRFAVAVVVVLEASYDTHGHYVEPVACLRRLVGGWQEGGATRLEEGLAKAATPVQAIGHTPHINHSRTAVAKTKRRVSVKERPWIRTSSVSRERAFRSATISVFKLDSRQSIVDRLINSALTPSKKINMKGENDQDRRNSLRTGDPKPIQHLPPILGFANLMSRYQTGHDGLPRYWCQPCLLQACWMCNIEKPTFRVGALLKSGSQ